MTQIPILHISNVSDTDILNEYVRRFTLPPGAAYINRSRSAADHLRAYFADAAKREKFVVCFLNGQHQLITTEVLFEGSLTSSAVFPREVLGRVLDLGAGSVLLGHNHPSGCTDPSSSDRAVTKKLQTALGAIDVEILDHIIIGGGDYYSFADHNLI